MTFNLKPREIRGFGWKRQLPDARDKRFRAINVHDLPERVDLEPSMPPVLDQGNLGTCVTHAVTEAARYAIMQEGYTDVPLARLQLYADARRLEGTSLTEDSGLEIRDAIKCVAKLGLAHESLWPYKDDPVTFTRAPTDDVYRDAVLNQALLYEAVTVSPSIIKAALAQKLPVIMGITLYESFYDTKANGIVPTPRAGERVIGGHSMLTIGYGQMNGYFKVRNSWSDTWGDKGNCYIAEGYMGNTQYADDFWVLRVIEGFADSVHASRLQAWLDNPQQGAVS